MPRPPCERYAKAKRRKAKRKQQQQQQRQMNYDKLQAATAIRRTTTRTTGAPQWRHVVSVFGW